MQLKFLLYPLLEKKAWMEGYKVASRSMDTTVLLRLKQCPAKFKEDLKMIDDESAGMKVRLASSKC